MKSFTFILLITCIIAGCTSDNGSISKTPINEMVSNTEANAQKASDTNANTVSQEKKSSPVEINTDDVLQQEKTENITAKSSADTNKILVLAQCLTKKGATFYGTQRCSHCQNQKKMFGDAISAVNFVDCDDQADKCSQVQ